MTNWPRVIRAISPNAKPAIVDMIAKHADEQFDEWELTTLRRQAALLAHICVETNGFTTLEENLNYSAKRLREVWPRRFASDAEAEAVAHNPRALAIKVYGDRMGNRSGTDDGWIFRGKGLLQCTGRDNVTRLGKSLGLSPDAAAACLIHPDHALECACALFVMLGVVASADSGDVRAQTKRINGGYNGLKEREAALARASRALAREAAARRADDQDEKREPTPPVSARELRKAGSRTIMGADQAKSGLGGLATAAAGASAVASQIGDTAGQVQSAVDGVQSASGALAWAQSHWQLFAFAALLAAALYFAWRIYSGASLVQRARLDDANSGLNIGR